MLKKDGKVLTRIMAVATCSLCAHMAFAASTKTPAQDGPRLIPAVVSPTPLPAPAVSNASPAIDAAADIARPATIQTDLPDSTQIECVAKVIRHEAANQPIDGQVAVAQVIRARMKDGRFPTTACGVVKQRGQFFDVDAYDPPRDDMRWTTAIRIAGETLKGESPERASGALFFHSAGARMPGRVRIVQIADHIFYR